MACQEVKDMFPNLCMAVLTMDEDEEDECHLNRPMGLLHTAMIDMMRFHEKHESTFSSYLNSLDNLMFFQQLRLSKLAFNHLLSLLQAKQQITVYRRGKEKVSLLERLQVTLWYLANKTSFRETSFQFRLSISVTHKIFYCTVGQINELADTIIHWPTNIQETVNSFECIAGFPNVIGALDGTHIKISPPNTVHNEYLDRTMKHSIVLIAVCDANKKFTYISTGFAGSIHDQRCLSLSVLGQAVISPPNEYIPNHDLHILGDSGFQLYTGLMIPIQDNGRLSVIEQSYNYKHSKTRCIIENAFAFLKNRFRCLMHLEVDLPNCMPIIVACCTLHNIALSHHDYLQESYTSDSMESHCSVSAPSEVPVNPNAEAKQRAICTMLA